MDLPGIDHVLTTTRTVRKRLDFDRPVPAETIQECLRIAIQAPTGGNQQGWRWLVVTDAEKRRRLGELYGKAFGIYARAMEGSGRKLDDQMQKVVSSSVYLAQNMGRAPVLVIPCQQGRPEGADVTAQSGFWGSILPAAWSFMLALRARGLGCAWTTLHLMFEKDAAALLGVPADFTQAALLPVAWFTGDDFQPAKRTPVEELTYWDAWGQTR